MKKIFYLCLCLITACVPATVTAVNVPTVDPFVAVEQAQMTASAAQDEAEFYGSQLTATAQAPIVAITATAAAWAMEQQYAQATQQAQMATETAAYTATALNWTSTPDATTTAVFAQSYADATKIANGIQIDNLQVERARTTNTMRALSLYVIGILALMVAVMFGIGLARKVSIYAVPMDDRGNPRPIYIDGIIADIDRSPNGMMSTDQRFVKRLPALTADRQDAVTERDQLVDLRTRIASSRRLLDGQKALSAPTAIPAAELDAGNLPLPGWEFMRDWKGDSLPLGFGRKGLITAQAASPHILVSGKTGSGKTLYMLRTLTTAALSKGYQVVNLGFSDSGFGVFSNHPNYLSVKLGKTSEIIDCLRHVYEEMQARKALIGGAAIEWEYWPGGTPPRPFVQLLIDELGNMAEDIYTIDGASANKELWRWISMIANEGRKVGIRFMAALQDPTAKSIDLRFRRNCTLVAFQQGDASQSSAFLGTTGAEKLRVGHFMARIDALVIGGGFSPTDDEIQEYLDSHSVEPAIQPEWIKGIPGPVEPKQLRGRDEATVSQSPSDITQLAESIRSQWNEQMSKRAVGRLLGKDYAGGWAAKIDLVVRYLGATTTATAQNSQEMAGFM